HRAVGDAGCEQALSQADKLIGHDPESSRLGVLRRDSACHHRLLVDVQPTTPFVDRPHCLPPSSRLSSGGRPGPVKSFPCVLSPKRGDIRWYPKVAAHVSHRAPTHKTQTSISTTRRKPIFILGGAEEASVVPLKIRGRSGSHRLDRHFVTEPLEASQGALD